MTASEKIIETIKQLNPGIDVNGPITDLIANPVGSEIDDLDERILSIQKLLSSSFDDSRTDDEIEALAATRGVIRNPGDKSTCNISFRFSSLPLAINLPSGTEIATLDSLYQFILVEDFAPTNTEIQNSYNSATGLYELTALIEAAEIGERYNVAANRLRRINIQLPPGTSLVNLEAASGGSDVQTNEELWDEFQDKGILSDSSSNSGKSQDIVKEFPDIKDVYIDTNITPINPVTLDDPVINVYVIGETLTEVTEDLTVANQKITLSHKYISSITSIKYGVTDILLYSNDDNLVSINETIANGETVTVIYFYNKLLEDLQTFVNDQENNLFNYRLIVTEAIKQELKISVTIAFQSSFVASINKSSVEEVIADYYNSIYFTTEDIQLQDLATLIRNSFAGVVNVTITEFTPLELSSYLVGFPVYVQAPKYPYISAENLNVSIVSG